MQKWRKTIPFPCKHHEFEAMLKSFCIFNNTRYKDEINNDYDDVNAVLNFY